MERNHRHAFNGAAKVSQFLLVVGVMGVLAYAAMYLMAMSPLLVRALGPVLTSG